MKDRRLEGNKQVADMLNLSPDWECISLAQCHSAIHPRQVALDGEIFGNMV